MRKGRGALIGMNCVVNDNAEVGEDAVVAALAFIKAEEDNMRLYQELATRSSKMKLVDALTTVEPGRRRIDIPGAVPLSELKKKHA